MSNTPSVGVSLSISSPPSREVSTDVVQDHAQSQEVRNRILEHLSSKFHPLPLTLVSNPRSFGMSNAINFGKTTKQPTAKSRAKNHGGESVVERPGDKAEAKSTTTPISPTAPTSTTPRNDNSTNSTTPLPPTATTALVSKTEISRGGNHQAPGTGSAEDDEEYITVCATSWSVICFLISNFHTVVYLGWALRLLVTTPDASMVVTGTRNVRVNAKVTTNFTEHTISSSRQ